jgi:hypothetical protein
LVLLALIAAFALVVGVIQLTVAVGGERIARREARRLTGAAV